MTAEHRKLEAARAALAYLPDHGTIGLGSGSTAQLFIDAVAGLVEAGRQLVGVPTSEASRQQAASLGIRLLDDAGPWQLDVCVDGADEVSANLHLIKGGGGCHTREKIINHASLLNVIIVDDSKLSQRLGEKWPVPVEILRFAEHTTRAHLGQLGPAQLRLRHGVPWITDSGNLIYDVQMGPMDDPAAVDRRLREIPGVVETGLFVGRADIVLVASAAGVRELRPAAP